MGTDKKNSTVDDGKKKGINPLSLITKFFWHSLYHKELGAINDSLIKAHEISPSPYFMKLLRKNRVIWAVASLPSLINIALLWVYFSQENTVTKNLLQIFKMARQAIDAKNPEILNAVTFSENFFVYLGMIVIQVIGLTAFSWVLMAIIKRVNPIIRESLEFREYCKTKSYSTDQDQFFLVCKAGVLARISSASGDDLIKDKHLWRHLNKIPKDPVESPKDRNIVFIGNGFTLQRYEFKIT